MENTFLDYEGLKHLIKTQEAADVDDSKYLKQYAAMPEAGEDLLNEIAQYIGATTSDYKNGYFYKCVAGTDIRTYEINKSDACDEVNFKFNEDYMAQLPFIREVAGGGLYALFDLTNYHVTAQTPEVPQLDGQPVLQWEYPFRFWYGDTFDEDRFVDVSGDSITLIAENLAGGYVWEGIEFGDDIQVSAMPTANAENLNRIVQYIGETTASYTNGYFYKCVSDGETTPTYSWVEVIGAGEKEVVHVDALPAAPDIEDKVYETYGNSEHVVMTVPEVADFETYFSQFEFFNVSADAADVKDGYKVVAYDVAARIPNYGNWAITIDPSPSSSDHPYIIYFVSSTGDIVQDKTAMVGHTLSLDVVDKSVVDVYVGDATNQTLIPISDSSVEVDNETIIKDANDVISVSPNFKATFKGTREQWRALTAEQKAVFANGFVNITNDYEEGGSGGGTTTSDEIWVSRVSPVIHIPYESGYHYSRVYFSDIAGGRHDWTIKPNGTEIFYVCLPRSSGNLITHKVKLDAKNLSTGAWFAATSEGLLDELVPPSTNSKYGDYSGYIVLKNNTEYEYALRLTMIGNTNGYPTTDNIMFVLRRCILSEADKATYAEAILADTNVLSASVEIGS